MGKLLKLINTYTYIYIYIYIYTKTILGGPPPRSNYSSVTAHFPESSEKVCSIVLQCSDLKSKSTTYLLHLYATLNTFLHLLLLFMVSSKRLSFWARRVAFCYLLGFCVFFLVRSLMELCVWNWMTVHVFYFLFFII